MKQNPLLSQEFRALGISHLILGSQSKYRKSLLKRLGIPFKAKAHRCDEEKLKRTYSGNPQKLSANLALNKCKSLSPLFEKDLILCSDQVVRMGEQIFDKAHTKRKATQQLQVLQGQSHYLDCSICLFWKNKFYLKTRRAKITLRPLNSLEIRSYLEHDEPYDCAGSYKIESAGPYIFHSIQCQEPSAIEGIPLSTLLSMIRQLR